MNKFMVAAEKTERQKTLSLGGNDFAMVVVADNVYSVWSASGDRRSDKDDVGKLFGI